MWPEFAVGVAGQCGAFTVEVNCGILRKGNGERESCPGMVSV